MSENGRRAPVITMRDLVLPNDTNHYNTLFGGVLLGHMDKAAFLAASRFCKENVVTASVDTVHFHRPVRLGDTWLIEARVADVGRSSLCVFVDVYREPLQGDGREHCCRGVFTMVAVDEDMKPVTVPELLLETAEEINLAKEARSIRQKLKETRPEKS